MANGLAYAMGGVNPAFSLPPDFQINDLSVYEEQRRKAFADDLRAQLAARRKQLSEALTTQGKQLFDAANPGILEDLNSRGLLTSPTAVSQQQTNALRDIGLENQKYLNEFDTAATGAGLQADQDALDSGLELRRSDLEHRIQQGQSIEEMGLAKDLARQQGRKSLYGSLIGAAGNLGGAYLGAKALGGAGLFGGGTAGTAGASGAGPLGIPLSGAGAAPTGLAGFGGLGGLAAIGGAGIGSMMLSQAVANRAIPKVGQFGGNALGVVANPIGAQLNAAKKIVSNPGQAISSVGNSLKKTFCFDAETPIEMEDGHQIPISRLYIGAETKGGIVEKLSTAKVSDGDRYLWKGIKVTGSHAVKEDGKWIRVEDSPYAARQKGGGIVWSIVTDKHRVWINGLELADENETDKWEELSMVESLAELNAQEKAVR